MRLDDQGHESYDPDMPTPQGVQQPSPPSTDVERERLLAAIEEGLADLDAGRSYSHEEVLAEMRELFPPPRK